MDVVDGAGFGYGDGIRVRCQRPEMPSECEMGPKEVSSSCSITRSACGGPCSGEDQRGPIGTNGHWGPMAVVAGMCGQCGTFVPMGVELRLWGGWVQRGRTRGEQVLRSRCGSTTWQEGRRKVKSACTLAVRLDLLINLCIVLSVQTTLQMMLLHKTVTFSSADGVFSSSFLMTIFCGLPFSRGFL